MPRKTQEFGSLFEEDYLIRTLGRIAQEPEIALTELVANAWDAGACEVNLTIPLVLEGVLSVVDDGHGMTAKQFKDRWMVLSYDRLKHQGNDVEFSADRTGWRRSAYGRNGVGRHGMLCFGDSYEVESWREGKGTRFVVSTASRSTPFKTDKETCFDRSGHGTRLSVTVKRHLPDASQIRQLLSARFLHEPRFTVRVNGQSISLPEHAGLVERTRLELPAGRSVDAFVVDSAKAAKSTLYQGIAFWVNGRLVGVPSWIVGNTAVVDGRSRFAKQYAIVVSAGDDWIAEVEPDWSKFKSVPAVQKLYDAVYLYAQDVLGKLSANLIDENSEDALVKNREQFRELPTLSRIEVASFAQELVKRQPTIAPETLAAAVEVVINLEKSRSGASLLEKLTKLDDADVQGLDRLLGQWTVRDALSVLDEIDHRLGVVVAIEKLCGDSSSDELHSLHPLVTQARWLFGPEFDSHEYASNVTLRTAANKVFGKRIVGSSFLNAKQRPDIVVLADSTCSVVGTEAFDSGDQTLISVQDVLIIELKKGKSVIGREEMNQADGYVQDFLASGALDGTPIFRAYVVGHEIAAKTSREKDIKDDGVLRGRVIATTYGQLTRSANRRLFRLREKIPARYEELTGAEMMSRVMGIPSQRSIDIPTSATQSTAVA
jgi:hypothetical protein